jgi:hypothetical protein
MNEIEVFDKPVRMVPAVRWCGRCRSRPDWNCDMWLRKKEEVLAKHGTCTECDAVANCVHHERYANGEGKCALADVPEYYLRPKCWLHHHVIHLVRKMVQEVIARYRRPELFDGV